MISWPWQCNFKSYKNQTCHQRNSEARNFIEPLREPRAHLARVVYLILTKRVWRNNRRAVSDGQTDEPNTKSGFGATKHLNFDVKKDMRGKSMTLNSNFSKWGSGGIRKMILEFWKMILGTKIPNSVSKSWFWCVKSEILILENIFRSEILKILKIEIPKFGKALVPFCLQILNFATKFLFCRVCIGYFF